LIYIAIFFTIAGCNPDGIGCFKSSGSRETIGVNVQDFTAIDVTNNIEVHLSAGTTKSVQLTAGSNIIPGIQIEVIDGILYLGNLNTCNWTRNYDNPVVEISNPALTKIIQRGHGGVLSNETLTYENLEIDNNHGTGIITLDVNIKNLIIVSNEVTNFYITGRVDQLKLGYLYCDGIFFGEDLRVIDCEVTHIGSNSIHLDVSGSLKGDILGLGDVIVHHQMPKTVDVNISGGGNLIFNP